MTAVLEAPDLAALAAALGRRLRDAGLPVTHERSARFARATALVAPGTRTELYWTARAVFVSSEAQLPTFDRVFAAVFDPRLEPDAGARRPVLAPARLAGERAPAEPPRPLGRPGRRRRRARAEPDGRVVGRRPRARDRGAAGAGQ